MWHGQCSSLLHRMAEFTGLETHGNLTNLLSLSYVPYWYMPISIFCKVQTLSYQLPLYRYQHLHSNVLNLTMIQSTSYIGLKTLLSHAWHWCNRQRHITWLTELYSRSKNNIWILIHTTWILRIEEFKSHLSD